MDTENTDEAPALARRRITLAERRTKLALDASLIATYNTLRAANELLASLNSGDGGFSPEEYKCLQTAYRHSALALGALNEIVDDHGNQKNCTN